MSTPNAAAIALANFLLSPQETTPRTTLDASQAFLLSHHLRGQIEQRLDEGNVLGEISRTAISQAQKLPTDVREAVISRIRNTVASIAMHQ